MDYRSGEIPWITIESFGFTKGVPRMYGGGLLLDLRTADFDDPGEQEHLQHLDGTHPDVIAHVMASRMAFTALEQAAQQATALLDVNAEKNLVLHVLVGDDDGRTRAVVVGNVLAEVLDARGITTEVTHHHLASGTQK